MFGFGGAILRLMANERLAQWYVWQPDRRARLITRLSRQALENPRIGDLYWRSREQRSRLTAQASRRALQHPHIADWYWRRREAKLASGRSPGRGRSTAE